MTGKVYTEDEIANLSDEDLMGMAMPPQMEPSVAAVEEPDTGEESSGDEGVADEDVASGSEAADESDPDGDAGEAGEAGGEVSPPGETTTTSPADKAKPDAVEKDGAADKAEKPAETEKPQVQSEADLKSFYDRIMAPIKANGKDIQLKSADEVVRMIQMGANYTKKLQALQPSLKMLKMLENNGLLDEGKLTYLIDLDKKNPAAIQKFIKESGVDPLEIDTSVEPTYQPGNHKVSDQEMVFQSTLDELMLDKPGQDTIVAVNRSWDADSKKALMSEPNLLRVVHEQRQSGIYQQISDEIDRRRVLGALPVGQSFIQTYHAVGKEMDTQGLLVPKTQAAANQPSRVVETRVATKKTVVNDDKAKAASPTNSAPKKVAQDFNPLNLSDEEFEKSAALAQRL